MAPGIAMPAPDISGKALPPSVHGCDRQLFQFPNAHFRFLMHAQQNGGADGQLAVTDLADDRRLDFQHPAQLCIIFQVHLLNQGIE